MRNKLIHTLRLAVIMLISFPAASVTQAQNTRILSSGIASPTVTANDDWLSMPIVRLGEGKIDIGFDDLTHTYHRYVYSVEHCNADWTKSEELFTSDYIEGFAEGNTIDDVEESINTNTLYTHYSIGIPNDKCRLKMSGNYRLTVYDENDDQRPVLEVCFMVVEPLMSVRMEVSTNTDIDVNKEHQQLSMTLNYGSLRVTDPASQIKTVVLQNRQWHDARINVKPKMTMSDGLRWEHCREYIFKAGNEYHKFEILDTDHPSMGVDRIDWDGKNYNAYLFTDQPRPNYTYDEDANGAFCIRNSDNVEINTTSDYMNVHFRLMCPEPVSGSVYVNGAWTNDAFTDEYKMTYDFADKSYKARIPLKLGYYSYQYLVVSPSGITTLMPSEGSFWQTENEYQALIYYRMPGDRADRLVAYGQVKIN